MLEFLHFRITSALQLTPLQRSIYDQILVEYWQKANLMNKMAIWKTRNCRQRYSLAIPLSVVRILHQEMQYVELTIYGQAFLGRVDQYLTSSCTNIL